MLRLLPLLLLAAAAPAKAPPGAIPDPTALSRALAENNDWRAIVIVMTIVMFGLIGLMIWERVQFNRAMSAMTTAIDRMGTTVATAIDANREALTALRIVLAEDRAERRQGHQL